MRLEVTAQSKHIVFIPPKDRKNLPLSKSVLGNSGYTPSLGATALQSKLCNFSHNLVQLCLWPFQTLEVGLNKIPLQRIDALECAEQESVPTFVV